MSKHTQIVTSEDLIELVESLGIIAHSKTEKYMYFPYWMRRVSKTKLELLRLGQLPEELKDHLKSARGEPHKSKQKESFEKIFNYMYEDEIRNFEQESGYNFGAREITSDDIPENHILHHLLIVDKYFESL